MGWPFDADCASACCRYRIDATSAKRTLTAGTMVCAEKVVCYLV